MNRVSKNLLEFDILFFYENYRYFKLVMSEVWLFCVTTGVNFINVLRVALALVAPKSMRIQSSCQYLFTLLRSTGAKAARRMLVKLTPDVHFDLGRGFRNGCGGC